MSTMTPALPTLQESWISTRDNTLSDEFDRHPFEFAHTLADHPLLQIPALMELAERTVATRPDAIYYDLGVDKIEQRWDQVPPRQFSVLESMERLRDCGAWFLFKNVQNDPQYKVFLGEGWKRIKQIISPNLESRIWREDALIFITSPKRITPYHIDRECSFLLQIRGTKTVHVFDRGDREVLPETEIERFWTVDKNAPTYRPQFQGRATTFTLRPGYGVHIPVNCPHWVENGDDISVSLNVNVQFKDTLRANVYRANYLLRSFGLHPNPPGKSAFMDQVKVLSVIPIVASKPILKRLKSLYRKLKRRG